MTTMPNGDLVVGGRFYSVGGTMAVGIARWDGAAWHALSPGIQSPSDTVDALHVLPNGDLVAVGGFAFQSSASVPVSRVGRWDGSAWHPLGSGLTGYPLAIASTPTGDLVVGGIAVQSTGLPGNEIARWNGSAWTPIGVGVGGEILGAGPSVATLTRLGNGDLVVGGAFRTLGGVVSNHLARLSTTCPANVVGAGAGCGSATLTADHAWAGATWTARASNLPAAALVFATFGLTPTTLPLGSVFATAVPGCTLHVTPDLVTLALAMNGTVTTSFALPADPALSGVAFRHQMVPLALDATLAVTATNALQMTVGAW